jgi:hypothetical protein
MVAYTHLRLAGHLVDDLRRPWHPRPDPSRPLSPYQVRLGFRRLRAKLGTPADSPKPSRPGPGRPKGSKNRPKDKRPPTANATNPTQSTRRTLRRQVKSQAKGTCVQAPPVFTAGTGAPKPDVGGDGGGARGSVSDCPVQAVPFRLLWSGCVRRRMTGRFGLGPEGWRCTFRSTPVRPLQFEPGRLRNRTPRWCR